MLKLLRKLHAWCGLAICLLIFPIALSGAVLTLKAQWTHVRAPATAGSDVPVTPAEAARVMAAADKALGPVQYVLFAGPEIGAHEAVLASGGGAYLDRQGRVVARWDAGQRAGDWLLHLHQKLLLGRKGQLVAAAVGALTFGMALSGLVIVMPSLRSFRLRLVPGGRGRAGWLAAHRDVGLIVAPVILAATVTGVTLSLAAETAKVFRFQQASPPPAGAGPTDWRKAFEAAQARFPGAALRAALPPGGPGFTATVRLEQPWEWDPNGMTSAYVDPATSRVTAADDPANQGAVQRLYNTFWSIHTSKVGGLAWKIASILGGLGLAALSLYGAESYRRKLFPGRRSRR